MKDDHKRTVIYDNVDEFNNQNTREITYLWAFDVINRLTGLYRDIVSEPDTKCINETNIAVSLDS